jgi:AcrR family transcriptional regulator
MASSKAAQRRKPHRERVADILTAAREVFAERGYEGAAMTDIARRAGIVEGTIYKHFKNKRDLLFQVTRAVYEPLICSVAAELKAIDGARNQLRFLIWRQLRELTQDHGVARVVIGELRANQDEYQATVIDLQRQVNALVVDVLERGIASGELRAGLPVKIVRDVIVASVEHQVWKAVSGAPGSCDPGRVTDDLLATLLDGIAQPAAEATDSTLTRLHGLLDRIEGIERRLAGAGLPDLSDPQGPPR